MECFCQIKSTKETLYQSKCFGLNSKYMIGLEGKKQVNSDSGQRVYLLTSLKSSTSFICVGMSPVTSHNPTSIKDST